MLDSSTLLQSNESDGWSKERSRKLESRKPRHSCAVSAPKSPLFYFCHFPIFKKSFPWGLRYKQPAAAYRCLVVTGHKPKLEQVSSLVCLPRLSPSKQSSKPRTRNLPSKLQVTTKKSPSDCNGGKGWRCSGRRPWIRSWSLQSRHNHGRGAWSSKGVPVLSLAVGVPHAVTATGRSWPRRGCHCNPACVESGWGQAERGRGGQRHADGWAEWACQLELRTAQGPPARLRQAPDPSHSWSVCTLWKCKASSFFLSNQRFPSLLYNFLLRLLPLLISVTFAWMGSS